MTAKQYGPILLIGVWDAKQKEPIYLITSLADANDAVERYRVRFRIECMFANHKSRGFRIDKSHLAAPERLARLVIATSLAYVWIHAAAGFAQAHGWVEQFHRTDRCDLGLFQIGLRAIQYALREGLRVPVSFLLPLEPPATPQMANECSVLRVKPVGSSAELARGGSGQASHGPLITWEEIDRLATHLPRRVVERRADRRLDTRFVIGNAQTVNRLASNLGARVIPKQLNE
jgi:hypothetical protein